MEQLTSDILTKLNNISLEELAETLPTALTTDAHILKAEEKHGEEKWWEAFHHLSLSHSTLMYHRLSHKLHRPYRSKENATNGLETEQAPTHVENGISNGTDILRPSSPDDTKNLLEMLPSDWTLVQISSENKQSRDERNWRKVDDPFHMPSLFISRCKCGTKPSVLIKKLGHPKEESSVRSILQEMELIKGENKVISKYYKNDQEKFMSKKEELNSRVRILVQSMENGWLRHFLCLLVGSLPPHLESQVEAKVKEAVSKAKLSLAEHQLEFLKLLVSFPPSSPDKGTTSSFELSLRAGIASLLHESVRSPKVKTLSAALADVQVSITEIRNTNRNPVVLILDKAVVSLPWEMLHGLQRQSVTRMPSLQSLVHLYLHHLQKSDSLLTKGIDATKGFFILDPENNLPRSQERLQETFSLTGWDGVKGKKPTHDQFKEALASKDLFVFVGHGSGSQYMPAQLVETVECRSAVLLYGCSSASLARRGSVPDPWGVILNYLIASCPCVVGMLWEVMDRDTDLLTREMVRALRGQTGPSGSPLEHPPTDVALLVARARSLCSWYLISAALVVYGLPLQVVPKGESTGDGS